jgi:hypothetical protein
VHRISGPLTPETKLPAVGECIYCRRKPPEVSLTNEHIIADGLGGDLILPDASCHDCARKTGKVEQDILRYALQQPRGALGVRSRKKRPKQTSIRANIAEDGEPPRFKEIPFEPGMPAFLLTVVGDNPPGIMRGAPRDEGWMGRVQLSTQADFNERGMKTIGEGSFRYGFKFHAGIFGQLIAKTSHAFAVAHLGVGGFEPFLTEFIVADEPPFDSYHLASLTYPPQSAYLHEIALQSVFVPATSIIGVGLREVYAVRWRMFGQLSGPVLIAVVGKPTNRVSPATIE